MQASEALVAGAHSRLRRLDLRVAVGLLLMLVAVLGGASLIRSAQDRIPVLVAAGSVQPGEVIGPSGDGVGRFRPPSGIAAATAYHKLIVASSNTPSLEVFRTKGDPVAARKPQPVVSAASLAFPETAGRRLEEIAPEA